jgi:hypothetical protein
MSENEKIPKFIFDANFFICLKEAKAQRPYYLLYLAKKKINLDFYVSAMVFNECPFIVGTDFQEFSKAIQVELVADSELDAIKKALGMKGVSSMAQDPDLTLIALAKRMKDQGNEVVIVSDDYKLSQNVESLQYSIKFWSLPGFLQFLAKNMAGKERDYFKVIRKRVLKLNLDYMLSRNDIYPAQAKIAWLLENAVSIADEGISLKQDVAAELQQEQKKEEQSELFVLSQNYIDRKTIPKEKQDQLKPYEGVLNQIQEVRELIKAAQEKFTQDEGGIALAKLRKAEEKLIQNFQYLAAAYAKKEFRFLELILASEISKVDFIRAFVLVGRGKFSLAHNSLQQTAVFASLARMPETVLTINFLIALISMFESQYENAVNQFKFLRTLADSYGNQILIMKALIGEMITLYLIGQHEEAFALIDTFKGVLGDSKSYLDAFTSALSDSGDYFLAMGFPEIASNLYSNALEASVDNEKTLIARRILQKMKKSYMASALIGYAVRPSADISSLIDKMYDGKNVDGFNEQMIKLAEFTNQLYTPFEIVQEQKKKRTAAKKSGEKTPKLTFYDLPPEMQEEFECVKIQDNPETDRTLLIAFREEIGLIAFDVVLDKPLEGVPENYTIQIKKTAQLSINPVDMIKEALFLIRAIVRVTDIERDIEIKRNIPAFFTQIKF